MISISKSSVDEIRSNDEYMIFELRGKSTDTKPTEINGKTIDNGSTYIEIDTGKIYMYDLSTETWNEV